MSSVDAVRIPKRTTSPPRRPQRSGADHARPTARHAAPRILLSRIGCVHPSQVSRILAGEWLRCRISLHPQKSLCAAPVRTLVGLESARKRVLPTAVFRGGKSDARADLGRMIAEDARRRGGAEEAGD